MNLSRQLELARQLAFEPWDDVLEHPEVYAFHKSGLEVIVGPVVHAIALDPPVVLETPTERYKGDFFPSARFAIGHIGLADVKEIRKEPSPHRLSAGVVLDVFGLVRIERFIT